MLSAFGILGLVASLALAAVFAVAGLAKLADLAGTRRAVVGFGVPEPLGAPLAVALPISELAVAALLLPASTRALGAAGALGLLVVFSTVIAASLARGNAPDCHCFGQLHSAPASSRTLARNGALAGIAVIVLGSALTGERTSALAWVRALDGSEVGALAFAIVLMAFSAIGTLAFVSLMRSHGRTLLRLETIERRLTEAGIEIEQEDAPPELGLEPGTPAPAFTAADVRGTSVSLDDLLAPGLPLLLLFTTPNCGPCQALLPDIAAWQAEHVDRLTIAIADDGDREVSLAKAQEHGLERVLVDRELAIHAAYEVGGTPSAVLIAPDGTIASHLAPGVDWIEQLRDRALAGSGEADEEGLPPGAPAPDLELLTLDGEPVSVASPDGETLVLFWNPDCGFCGSMREDVLAWERHAPVDAPRLLVVSSGDEASTRAEGFASAVVLDADFAVGTAFGAGGTPMAVLLDRDGRIASSLAAGAEAVFALAGDHSPVDSSEDMGVAARAQR